MNPQNECNVKYEIVTLGLVFPQRISRCFEVFSTSHAEEGEVDLL